MPASIQDVADAAGVSIATVSRVLNNPKLVSAATASKVRDAIERLGYVPNAFAQGLITKASKLLGIALPDIHGEFYSELLHGADEEARRMGYHLLVTSRLGGGAAAASGAAVAGENGATGLGPAMSFLDGLALMITEPNEALIKRLAATGLPLVVLDAAPEGLAIDTITIDNEAGATTATEHLLTLVQPSACQFVGGPKDNFDTARRAAAFRDTLARRGGGRGDAVAFGDYSFEWGRERAKQLHRAGLLEGAGVLTANDEIAYGVMHAARELGLDVPRQLVIVGFDDTRLASLVRPTLSTVRVPLMEVGATAVRLLIRRLRDDASQPEHVKLTPTLVVRESTTRV